MKNIDIKSVVIGVLLTTTIIFGMGAGATGEKYGFDSYQTCLYASEQSLDKMEYIANLGIVRGNVYG